MTIVSWRFAKSREVPSPPKKSNSAIEPRKVLTVHHHHTCASNPCMSALSPNKPTSRRDPNDDPGPCTPFGQVEGRVEGVLAVVDPLEITAFSELDDDPTIAFAFQASDMALTHLQPGLVGVGLNRVGQMGREAVASFAQRLALGTFCPGNPEIFFG